MPKISVIVPIFNEEKYLIKCMDSIVGQSLEDIEILCIDDGSTDGSLRLQETYQRSDSRIKLIKQGNQGSGAARNKGLDIAKGEFIAFIDADDYYCNHKALENLYDAAKKNEALICGGYHLFELHSNASPRSSFSVECSENGVFMDYVDCQISLGYQPFIYSRELIKKHSISFPNYLRFQDPPFFVRALLAAERFYFIPKGIYAYRYGHKRLTWNTQKVNDLCRGLIDNLSLSAEHNLNKLHNDTVEYFNVDYFSIMLDSLVEGNEELLSLLKKANEIIKPTLLTSKATEKQSYIHLLNNITVDARNDFLKKITSSRTLIYYGAGNKGKRMISQAKALHGKLPDIVWDINAASIKSVGNVTVTEPDFSLLDTNSALIICVEDSSIARSVRLSCETHAFYNVYDWSTVQRAYLDSSLCFAQRNTSKMRASIL